MGVGVSASVGQVGTINAAQWGVLMGPTNRGYVEGCAVTAGGGTRQVPVASGRVWVANSYHDVSGATLSLPENTSGQPRRDYIALYFDWTSDAAVVSLTGTPAAFPSPPVASLTSAAGSSWHVPLAEVRINSGDGVLPAGQVNDRRPGPWLEFDPQSPWGNYSSVFGGGWATLAIRKDPFGDVHMRGLVATTSTITSPTSQTIIAMPLLWRPAKQEIFAVSAKDASSTAEVGRVDVPADGTVSVRYPQSTTGTRWYSLAGISFTPAT